jgi:2-oxoisovalerate dehydrogenase E1 component beta subunit
VGAGIHGSIYHSHSFDAQATRIPGWKIVMPSRPYDAYGLMLSAIEDPNPVMVLLPKALLRAKAKEGELIPGEPEDSRELSRRIDAPVGDRSQWVPDWPDTAVEMIPLGKARTVREGRDVTVVAYGRSLLLAERAAGELADKEGIDAEVLDLRSLHPYDWEAIAASVRKTGRVLFVNEDTEVTNFGEHLMRRCVEELFQELRVPPRLHAGKHVPGIGLSEVLENASVPMPESVMEAIRGVATEPEVRAAGQPQAPAAAGRALAWGFQISDDPRDFDQTDALARAFDAART